MAFVMKIQKVKALPIFSIRIGKNCETKYTADHMVNVEIDMAKPLILVGKISERITQGIGPKDIAKKAI